MMVLDPETHTYTDTDDPDREYVSVSHVIRRLGMPRSWKGKAPAGVVEFARERGLAVERVLYSLIQGEAASVEVPDLWQNGTSLHDSVMELVPGVQRWLEDARPKYEAHQLIVHDPDAGIAGTLDLLADGAIIDVKCTAKEEADWEIQLGAYATMLRDNRPVAVLHINKRMSKGYMNREYNVERCVSLWMHAREAWMDSCQAFDRARDRILTA